MKNTHTSYIINYYHNYTRYRTKLKFFAIEINWREDYYRLSNDPGVTIGTIGKSTKNTHTNDAIVRDVCTALLIKLNWKWNENCVWIYTFHCDFAPLRSRSNTIRFWEKKTICKVRIFDQPRQNWFDHDLTVNQGNSLQEMRVAPTLDEHTHKNVIKKILTTFVTTFNMRHRWLAPPMFVSSPNSPVTAWLLFMWRYASGRRPVKCMQPLTYIASRCLCFVSVFAELKHVCVVSKWTMDAGYYGQFGICMRVTVVILTCCSCLDCACGNVQKILL